MMRKFRQISRLLANHTEEIALTETRKVNCSCKRCLDIKEVIKTNYLNKVGIKKHITSEKTLFVTCELKLNEAI